MGSLALNSLFTVAHFIKARCEHGLRAGELKDKNYIFFEVEILDYKTNKQLCFLDKVEPHATIKEIKSLLYKCYPKLYPARQSLKLHPRYLRCILAERDQSHDSLHPKFILGRQDSKTGLAKTTKGNALKDDDILENLPVGTTATMYFKDLGPQLGWTMVFLVEYIGPLFIYLLFYFRLPYIYSQKYTFTSSPYPVVPLACACHSFHYIKRLIETIFVHRFSHGTMPLRTMLKNCLYYWGFSAWLAYYINHPLYTPPSYGNKQVHYALIMFVLCEAGNFSINLTLNNMKSSGTLLTRFPYPTRNPFTWLFFFVSCPNYTYEVGTWIGFTIMTQCAPVALYTLVGFIQMAIWARGKHKTYIQQFKNYPGLRMAIIPLFL